LSRLVVVAAAALALAGCKSTPENGYAVDVTVTIDQSVPTSAISQIAVLDIAVAGAETFHTADPINGQLNGRSGKFIYRPSVGSGALAFTITAFDIGGATIAVGQGSATLKSGETVTLTVTLSASTTGPDMTELADMAMPDMTCVPESDLDFCARLGKNCESVTDNDNCGTPRTVTSCGTCDTVTPACVANVCKVPVCSAVYSATSTTVSAASVAAVQDDLLGASSSGDSLLLLRPGTGACGPNTLFIADATTSGSMAAYNVQSINTLAGFQKVEETMTLTADGLTIIGTDATAKAFVMSTRTAVGMTNFGTAAAGPYAAINAAISTTGGTASWPVLSSDGLAFYYRIGGATVATDNGIYESLRAATSANFPAGTKMPAAVQAFDGISGISTDRMTLFMETGLGTGGFATKIMTRNSLTQPFTVPTTTTPPAGWRAVPVAGCTKVIGTCEPGGCGNEDVCTWAKM
jgi:hypothetical protein